MKTLYRTYRTTCRPVYKTGRRTIYLVDSRCRPPSVAQTGTRPTTAQSVRCKRRKEEKERTRPKHVSGVSIPPPVLLSRLSSLYYLGDGHERLQVGVEFVHATGGHVADLASRKYALGRQLGHRYLGEHGTQHGVERKKFTISPPNAVLLPRA